MFTPTLTSTSTNTPTHTASHTPGNTPSPTYTPSNTPTYTPSPAPGNHPPGIAIYLPEVSVRRGSWIFNVGDYIDRDRDTVRLSVSVGNIIQTGRNRGLWVWTYLVPPSTPRGLLTVTITATDARGGTTTQSFIVRVR